MDAYKGKRTPVLVQQRAGPFWLILVEDSGHNARAAKLNAAHEPHMKENERKRCFRPSSRFRAKKKKNGSSTFVPLFRVGRTVFNLVPACLLSAYLYSILFSCRAVRSLFSALLTMS